MSKPKDVFCTQEIMKQLTDTFYFEQEVIKGKLSNRQKALDWRQRCPS